MRLVEKAGLIACSFRTLPPFKLVRAATVREAVSALASAERAAVLAGGTDLPARFNDGFSPSHLIVISGISLLHSIAVVDGALEIGAAVTHADGSRHPLVKQNLSGFATAWSRIANVRVRFSATLGGNVMARRARYEGALLLTALGATLRFATTNGDIDLPAQQIWNTELPREALLTTIRIPLGPSLRFEYDRGLRPILTQAVAVDDAGLHCIVTGTEHVQPRVRTASDDGRLEPTTFSDPVTSDDYLNRVSEVLLVRQMGRLNARAHA